MDLRSALNGCSSSQLSRMAAAQALVVEAGTLRRELVELLATRILAASDEAASWTRLPEMARVVVQRLVRAGGRHESELLAKRLARGAHGEQDADARTAQFEGAVAELLDRGLVFRLFEADEQRGGIYLLLPEELLSAARQHLGDVLTGDAPAPVDPPDRVAHVNLAADLFILMSALRREAWGAASRDLAGRPGRTVAQILGRLRRDTGDGPGDAGRRWRVLLWLSQRAGWLSRGGWPTPDDDAVERLLTDPGRLPALALAAGPVRSEEAGRASAGKSDTRRRQADALQLLSELRDGGWWSATELVGWLASELTEPAESSGPARAALDRRRLEDQLGRWLAGRWFWLGLVTWGWDGANWGLVAPTDALRSLVTGRPAANRETIVCSVAGPRALEAPLDTDLATLYRAEQYLALVGGDQDRRRYSLTPASFDRGVRMGGDPNELRSLLGRLLGEPVPPEWVAALDTWSDGSSRLRLAARLILSSDQPETLEEALAVPTARDAVAEPLTSRHVLVDGAQVAEMLAELAQAGLPVDVDPGLRVEPRDLGRSAALAGSVAETAWVALEVLRRLAPEAVAEQRDLQAARGRLDAVLGTRVIEALERRAAAIVTAIANRRRPRAGRRVV